MANNRLKRVPFPQFPPLKTDDRQMMQLYEYLRAIALWSKSFEKAIAQAFGDGFSSRTLTQAEYDDLATKDQNTVYFIVD